MTTSEREEYKQDRSTTAMLFLNGLLSNSVIMEGIQINKFSYQDLVDISLDTSEAFIKEVKTRDEILDQKYPDKEEN